MHICTHKHCISFKASKSNKISTYRDLSTETAIDLTANVQQREKKPTFKAFLCVSLTRETLNCACILHCHCCVVLCTALGHFAVCAERLDALDHVEIGELVDGLGSLCNKISSNDDDGQFGVSLARRMGKCVERLYCLFDCLCSRESRFPKKKLIWSDFSAELAALCRSLERDFSCSLRRASLMKWAREYLCADYCDYCWSFGTCRRRQENPHVIRCKSAKAKNSSRGHHNSVGVPPLQTVFVQ